MQERKWWGSWENIESPQEMRDTMGASGRIDQIRFHADHPQTPGKPVLREQERYSRNNTDMVKNEGDAEWIYP